MAIPITDVSWGSIMTPHRLNETGVRRGVLEDLAAIAGVNEYRRGNVNVLEIEFIELLANGYQAAGIFESSGVQKDLVHQAEDGCIRKS